MLPAHPPRALLAAHGYLPVEVWGPPRQDTSAGDVHLQAYTCSVVRAGLSFLLGEQASEFDLVVVPHTCDSLQGLGSLMLDLLPASSAVVPFYLPRPNGPDAISFLAAELRAFSAKLGVVAGTSVSDDEVATALEADIEADRRYDSLLTRRNRLGLSARDFTTCLRSREYLPPSEFVAFADEVLARPEREQGEGIGVVLSGMMPEPMDILDTIEESGGRLVADDLGCCGRRRYPEGNADDPFERISERLLGAPPDPTRGVAVRDRIDHLSRLARESGARAVIFSQVKFCEPELFYLPQLRKALEADGLRTLTLEVDVTDALPHQVVTRVQALLETIE